MSSSTKRDGGEGPVLVDSLDAPVGLNRRRNRRIDDFDGSSVGECDGRASLCSDSLIRRGEHDRFRDGQDSSWAKFEYSSSSSSRGKVAVDLEIAERRSRRVQLEFATRVDPALPPSLPSSSKNTENSPEQQRFRFRSRR